MMIEEDFCLHKLVLRDIRPTAIRVLVLRTLLEMKQAMSVSDLEAQLDTVDKSTIFRTLTLFLSHHLIHGVDDGSGTLKYAVCDESISARKIILFPPQIAHDPTLTDYSFFRRAHAAHKPLIT